MCQSTTTASPIFLSRTRSQTSHTTPTWLSTSATTLHISDCLSWCGITLKYSTLKRQVRITHWVFNYKSNTINYVNKQTCFFTYHPNSFINTWCCQAVVCIEWCGLMEEGVHPRSGLVNSFKQRSTFVMRRCEASS